LVSKLDSIGAPAAKVVDLKESLLLVVVRMVISWGARNCKRVAGNHPSLAVNAIHAAKVLASFAY